MDSYRFLSLFTVILLGLSQHAHATSADEKSCFRECLKPSLLKKFETEMARLKTHQSAPNDCPVIEENNLPDHSSVKLGALKILAVSSQTCALPSEMKLNTDHFFQRLMKVQGLKLSIEPAAGKESKKFRDGRFDPRNLYQQFLKNPAAIGCFDVVTDEQNLMQGDLILSQDDVLVIDTVKGSLVDENCNINDLMNPHQFSVSVFHSKGRTPLFSGDATTSYGKTSSPWLTAFADRAQATRLACLRRKKGMMDAPLSLQPPVEAVVFLHHHSTSEAGCQLTPESADVACAKCCDFAQKESK
jgi:hypothetical protein